MSDECINLQLGVPSAVEQKEELIVVAFREQPIGEQNHQRLVRGNLLWTGLKELKAVVDEVLVNFLSKYSRRVLRKTPGINRKLDSERTFCMRY